MAPPWLPMAGKTKGFAPSAFRWSTTARTMTAMLAMPRLPAPTATVSPRLTGSRASAMAARTPAGMSAKRWRWKDCLTLYILGSGMAG